MRGKYNMFKYCLSQNNIQTYVLIFIFKMTLRRFIMMNNLLIQRNTKQTRLVGVENLSAYEKKLGDELENIDFY